LGLCWPYTWFTKVELRPYQNDTVDWLKAHRRNILGSSPGTGKTACVLRSIPEGPTLVVCGLKDAMWTWEREIPKWLSGAEFVVYHGTPTQRSRLETKGPDFLITTPRMLPEVMEKRQRWRDLVVDEAQYIRGRNIASTKALRKIRTEGFSWVSGSPMVKSPADLWVPLNLIDKKQFSSYWRWVFEHCIVYNNGFGNKVMGPSDAPRTAESLRPYYWAILKSMIQDQLPPKNRYSVFCELTPAQRKLYDELDKEMIGYLKGGELLLTPNVLALGTRIQQLFISPELLPGWKGPSESGMLSVLHDRVVEDFENEENVAIFTPYAEAIPIIARSLPPCEVFTFRGGQSNKKSIQGFQAFQGRKVLIGTIMSAASFDAYSATVGYFVGMEWLPAFNFQAEDRIHRLGQTHSVDIRYLAYRGTVQGDRQMDVLDERTTWAEALLGKVT